MSLTGEWGYSLLMDAHTTRKPKPDPIRLDYLITKQESELVDMPWLAKSQWRS